MDLSSQRLVQPWDTSQVDKLLATPPKWKQGAGSIALTAWLAALFLSMVSQALNAQTAALAISAIAWGFLTVVHVTQGSARPGCRPLIPLIPLIGLGAVVWVHGGTPQNPLAGLKPLGVLSGLAAFTAAAHLCMQRPSVSRPILIGLLALSSLFVAMGCATRLFSLASPDLSSLSFSWALQTLETQSDLVAMALVGLCLGLAMILEALEEAPGSLGLILIALVPFFLPLASSGQGATLSGGLLAGAIALLIFRGPANGFGKSHKLCIFGGVALASLALARASTLGFMALPDPPHTFGALWKQVLTGPVFGQPVPADLSGEPHIFTFLIRHGYGGATLLLLSLGLYLGLNLRRHAPHAILSHASLLSLGLLLLCGLWQSPFDHPVVLLTAATLLGSSCGNLRSLQFQSSQPKALLNEDPTPFSAPSTEAPSAPSA